MSAVAESTLQKKSVSEIISAALGWLRQNPLTAVAGALLVVTLVYFVGFVKLFTGESLSTWDWGWQAWSPKNNYEHAKLIPLIVAFLIWHSWDKLKAAPINSSRWGWLFLGLGIFLFVAGARTLQARLSLTAIPILLFGIILYVWGRKVARILLFPTAFLFFMVPLNFLSQATAKLQFIETEAAAAICNFIGIGIYTVGTTLNASDQSFHFQVDEGCSGIRSLMAIAMLSAIYGHLTQDRFWKKLVLFASAIVFAIIGNAGRLVSVVIVAKLFGQDLAGGRYHDVAGYLSFPFAIAAMLLCGKLLNLKPRRLRAAGLAKESVSYDY